MTTSPTSSNAPSFWEDWGLDLSPQPGGDSDFLAQFGYLPGLKELLTLRQVHALEHATVWVLSEAVRGTSEEGTEADLLSGMSTEQGFYLYGQVKTLQLQRAVQTALQRITTGAWNLAVHPRCGTNLSVGMLLTAGLTMGFHLLLPRGPITQLLGLGLATTAAAQLAPDVGALAQRYITTAIPFNLVVESITPLPAQSGRPTHFVRVRWVN